ncbi:DoxX family protein [Pseudobacter ginsenosidimutans]|nr:DoxX family protein [Pseudobacter ginsenosidimutans]
MCMQRFPFVSLRQSLLLLRCSVALIFLAHAVVRLLLNGSVEQFAGYLNNKGLVFGTAIVWMITVFEIIGGIALITGHYIRWFAAGFIVLLLVGCVLIHVERGWFVGEHGSGGCEYSFALIMALLVVAAAGRNPSLKTF